MKRINKWIKCKHWPKETGWYLTKRKERHIDGYNYNASYFEAETNDYNYPISKTGWGDVVAYKKIIETNIK